MEAMTMPRTIEGTIASLERQLVALSGPQTGQGPYYNGQRTALRKAIASLREQGPVRTLEWARRLDATAGYWAHCLDGRRDAARKAFCRGQAVQAGVIIQELEELVDAMRA